MEEIQVQLLGQEDSLEEDMATHPVFLHGGSHGQRSLVDCGSWGHKESGMTDMTQHKCTRCFSVVGIITPSHCLSVSVDWLKTFGNDSFGIFCILFFSQKHNLILNQQHSIATFAKMVDSR